MEVRIKILKSEKSILHKINLLKVNSIDFNAIQFINFTTEVLHD